MLVKNMLILFAMFFPLISNAQICSPNTIPATTPVSQFLNNNNGTVTDKKTGLTWKKCAEGYSWSASVNACNGNVTYYTWKDALDWTQAINNGTGFAGYYDWRVPNINELLSIIEEQCYWPSINISVFSDFDVSQYYMFWSSTPSSMSDDWAMTGEFAYGHPSHYYKNHGWAIRLVRGGQ